MARQLPFHALTSPTLRCPWRMLLWSYVGATRTSKLGDTSLGQGCSVMSISAITSKDASTEASVLPINYFRARVFWTKTPVLPINYFRARVFWTKTPVLPINYFRARVFWPKTPVLPINYIRARVIWPKTPVLSFNYFRARVFWPRTSVLQPNWPNLGVSGWLPMWCPPGLSTTDSLYWGIPVTWQCIYVCGARTSALGDSLLCTL